MRVLITAGSTQVPIDRVRSISNIFKGGTGWSIANYFHAAGAGVTILASAQYEIQAAKPLLFHYIPFQTYDELAALMERELRSCTYDAVIHSAAVSDYRVSRVLVREGAELVPVNHAGKISSLHDRLYLELAPTVKLVDLIRKPWGFKGKLVKFKLEVGLSDVELIEIARKSMTASDADFIVANCLEWHREHAYVISKDGSFENVMRDNLPEALLRRLR